MERVSSTNLQRRLSDYRHRASIHPVIIEDRGTPSVVMISYELFSELMALKSEKKSKAGFQAVEYNILGTSIVTTLSSLGRLRHGEGGKDGWISKSYANLERLVSLTPIDDTTFEVGGFIFDLQGNSKPVVSVSPWIMDETGDYDMEGFRTRWGCRLTTGLFLETGSRERPWEGVPSSDLLKALTFIPAVLGMAGEKDNVAEWIAMVATSNVFWDMDDRPIEKDLMKVAPSLIARNERLLKEHYPSFNRDAFVALFLG